MLLAEEVLEKCFKNILHFDVWNLLALDPLNYNAYFLIIHVEGKENKMHALATLRVHLNQYLTRLSL